MQYEAVCDCCMQSFYSMSVDRFPRDCPQCGVGMLLGPWPIAQRFQRHPVAAVVFPRFKEEVAVEPD